MKIGRNASAVQVFFFDFDASTSGATKDHARVFEIIDRDPEVGFARMAEPVGLTCTTRGCVTRPRFVSSKRLGTGSQSPLIDFPSIWRKRVRVRIRTTASPSIALPFDPARSAGECLGKCPDHTGRLKDQRASTAAIAFSISFFSFSRAAGRFQRSSRSGRVERQIESMSSRLVLRRVSRTTFL